MNIINGKYDKVKVYMDGKELPVCENSIVIDDDTGWELVERLPTPGAYSFDYTTTEETMKKLLWILDRPKRTKKYLNQIFSNDPL